MNRLSGEKSPYLIQHAENPVDWFPWTEEAFEKARHEDRLILVSIGYSSCHWCHVMAHESFEDLAVAEEMNRNLVCIKVDREERPDIDQEYMAVCQRLTGRGGWPLNVFLTPRGRPFLAATYIPRQGRDGRLGMIELVPHLASLWREKRDLILQTADSIAISVEPFPTVDLAGRIPAEAPGKACCHFRRHFDVDHGGFYSAPKFPMAQSLRFLMCHAYLAGQKDLLPLVWKTLDEMRCGGIWDHVGSGFHRYSVDRGWRLPHFEKMLYDQAMLALAYLEGWQITGNGRFFSTARDILKYACRDLQASSGGFFAARDADSAEGEGAFYTWEWRELKDILSAGELDRATRIWGLVPEGNFSPEVGTGMGRNLLALAGETNEDDRQEIQALRKKLMKAREKRPLPGRDEKVLTDWNGLMIAALARCGSCLREPFLVEAAGAAASFIRGGPYRPGGGLWHRWAEGEWSIPGFLDDYAFLTWGLIELYQATFDLSWLRWALFLAEDSLSRFAYPGSGGLAFSEGKDPLLPIRPPVGEDGPYPCGNGVMAHNLVVLGALAGRDDLTRRGEEIVRAFPFLLEKVPWIAVSLLDVLQILKAGSVRVHLGGIDTSAGHPFLHVLRDSFSPARVLAGVRPGTEDQAGGLLEEFPSLGGARPWAQVCGRGTCFPPVFHEEVLLEQLGSLEGGSREDA